MRWPRSAKPCERSTPKRHSRRSKLNVVQTNVKGGFFPTDDLAGCASESGVSHTGASGTRPTVAQLGSDILSLSMKTGLRARASLQYVAAGCDGRDVGPALGSLEGVVGIIPAHAAEVVGELALPQQFQGVRTQGDAILTRNRPATTHSTVKSASGPKSQPGSAATIPSVQTRAHWSNCTVGLRSP